MTIEYIQQSNRPGWGVAGKTTQLVFGKQGTLSLEVRAGRQQEAIRP